jgi:hypothetical protein
MNMNTALPDLQVRTADDQLVPLSSFLTSEHLLVVFLRHLV